MSAIRPGGATPPRPATVHATLACTAASPECLCPSGAACLEPPAKPLPADRHQRGRWWEQPWVVAGASASPPPSAPSVSSLHAPTAPTAHTLTCDHTQASAASAGSGLLGNVSSLVTAVSLFQRAPVEQPATQTHFGGWRRHARGAPPHHSGARLGAAARPLRTVAGPFVLRGGCLRCVWERVCTTHTYQAGRPASCAALQLGSHPGVHRKDGALRPATHPRARPTSARWPWWTPHQLWTRRTPGGYVTALTPSGSGPVWRGQSEG
jgi:hypothetical protein